jgi:hypothetical protein
MKKVKGSSIKINFLKVSFGTMSTRDGTVLHALRVNPAISAVEPYKITAIFSMPWMPLIGRQSFTKSRLNIGRIFCLHGNYLLTLSLFCRKMAFVFYQIMRARLCKSKVH